MGRSSSHRHRDEDKEDRKSHKKDRKERKKDEEHRHHKKDRKRSRHHDDDEDRSKKRAKHDKKKHKKKDKKDEKQSKRLKVKKDELVPLGDPLGKPPAQLLDPVDDYFAYHQHLWLYLYREESVAFDDLTSEQAREAFARFVAAYNAGRLEAAYYDKQLPPAAMEQAKTTRHSWSFNTSVTENKSLKALQDGVRKQTEYSNDQVSAPALTSVPSPAAQSHPAQRVANRRLREHVRTTKEELNGGRKEGRERLREKKREIGERTHGAARDKEAAPELEDSALYGGDDKAFRSALAREMDRTAKREEKKRSRLEELQDKEQQRQAEMFKKLGLPFTPGQKTQIPPRNDKR